MNPREPQECIAIVGMAGRFPQAANLEEFWRNLRAGRESISFFRDEPLQWLPLEHAPRADDPRYVRARGVLERPEWFDAAFFGMNPKEAGLMDPQHRVFLECAWEALENAGCNPDTYDGLIGVFAGASMNTYLLTNLMTNRDLIADFGMFSTLIMNDGDFVPTRVSYKFNLRGPSLNVQTACSTSLVAVALAAQNLLGFRCDVALAGGVSITFPATRGQFHLEGGILSHDGHCRAFDAAASGTVLGDGAGVVVLKRLSDAIHDGDRICAVIKGTAINNDGAAKIGYTAPSSDGQAEVIAMAHAEAGFAPETVSYVEAHGTGTPLGDPIEIAGLTKAFGLDGRGGHFCGLGSVKSNIGHLDIGAGVAGLIKTVLALQHRELPPSLHFATPNPKLDLANTPFYVNGALRPWQPARPGAPLRAGVSSFGIGGTNAHVALEEAPAVESSGPAWPQQLLLLSAKTPAALAAMAEKLAAHLAAMADADAGLADVAYTLQVGRKVFGCRRAVVAGRAAEAVASLRAAGAPGAVNRSAAPGTLAFLFPGQGAQAVNMARGLYETETDFRATVDRCSGLLRTPLAIDLRQVLFPEPDKAEAAAQLLNQTHLTQPAMFVIEYALAQLWMGWGFKPAALLGHSLGEYVAATIAGVFTLEDALALVAERARLMQAQPAGAMLAIRQTEAQVAAFLGENLALAAVNAPGLCVVSGPFDAVEAVEKRLAAGAISFQRLATSHAFHSAMMEPVVAPLTALLRRLKLRPPQIPWISNVTGTWITPEQATSADYWATHLRRPVRFADGVGELIKAGHTVLLEVGPGRVLTGLARQHPAAGGGAVTMAATLGRAASGGSDLGAVLHALGELWVAGLVPDWRGGFHRDERRRIVALPTYPFERKRCWVEPGAALAIAGPRGAAEATGTDVAAAKEPPSSEAVVETNARASTLESLRGLFRELSGLDLTTASPDASFYELGFDSLFLTQASLAVSRAFGTEVTFRQLREELSTLAKLTAHLDARVGAALVAALPSDERAHRQAVALHLQEQRLPLTDAQREMWFASQLGSAVSSAYNESSTLRLSGPLDVASLREACAQLVVRHEALRTTFSPAGEWQAIAPRADFTWKIVTAADDAAAEAVVAQAVAETFGLAGGPLLRVVLVRLDAGRHLLAVVVHHIICDGWSLGVLLRELGELYAAGIGRRPATLAAAPRFTDYVQAQAGRPETSAFAAAAAYWKAQFADTAPVIELPTDRPRPAERTYAGGFLVTTLSSGATRAVRQLCRERDCTAFTALLAAFNVLLHRLSGQDDLVVGVPSAAQVMDGVENLVGHFANLLPIRSRIDETRRFGDYLGEVKAHLTDALEHWRYPFGRLLQELNLPRDASRVPLAPVVFNTTRRRGALDFGGLGAEVAGNPKRFVNFDLNFNFMLADDTLSLGCYYSTELYDEATIARWFGHFETLMLAIAAEPDARLCELPLLNAAQRHEILVEWNATALEYPRDATIPELFAAQVRRTPDAIAVVGADERVTYAELDRRAEAIAARLRAAGVGRDAMVGLFLERSPRLLAGILGILKAGGGYVPLDPAYPKSRVAYIVGDTKMSVLVTERSLLAERPAGDMTVLVIDDGDPEAHFRPASLPRTTGSSGQPEAASLAYVIYTSGSTGQPKGVEITHRCVVALVAWARQLYRPGELAGVFFATSASFDISVFEIFCPLCLGGKLIVAENLLELGDHPARNEVTFLSGVPSAVAEVVRTQLIPASVRTVALAGELFPQPLVDALYQLPHLERVFELYGPTETTVYSTGSLRRANSAPTLGRPFPNERIYVLDRRLQPVPVGVAGELYIGGDKLARGYLNRPELTREKFLEAPFRAGERIYRTGDAARFRADGTAEFIGRLDQQVKIRGFRVELGEVEAALALHPTVGESVVITRPDTGGGNRLLAYVVPATAAGAESRVLRAHLAQRLPDYMVPGAITVVGKFPLTANGKLDRRALPEPDFATREAPAARARTSTEELVTEIWRDVLGVKSPGVDENFFELGGHSLLATQVIARLQDGLGTTISLSRFFAAPTIAGIARFLDEALIEEIRSGAGDVLAAGKEQP